MEPPARSAFTSRLAGSSKWTPELREYAVSFLLRHTTRASVYELLDTAGVDAPTTPFKTDNVRLLVARTSPASLPAAWQTWRAKRR